MLIESGRFKNKFYLTLMNFHYFYNLDFSQSLKTLNLVYLTFNIFFAILSHICYDQFSTKS
jgi:hypothetical protein